MEKVREVSYGDLERYLDAETRMVCDRLRDLAVFGALYEVLPEGLPTYWSPASEMVPVLKELDFTDAAWDIEEKVSRYDRLLEYTPSGASEGG